MHTSVSSYKVLYYTAQHTSLNSTLFLDSPLPSTGLIIQTKTVAKLRNRSKRP
jgi:hypothetical protein